MHYKEEIWIDPLTLKKGSANLDITDKVIYCRLFQQYETGDEDIVDGDYCEICDNICETGSYYFYIENDTKKFIVPKLILHYIRKHKLELPKELVSTFQNFNLPFPKSKFREMATNHIPKNDINFDPNTKKYPEYHKAAYDVRALKYSYDFGEISEEEYETKKEILTKIFHATM